LRDEAERRIHCGLLNRPAREALDQIARRRKHPRAPETIHDGGRLVAAAGSLKKSERGLEDVVGGREANRGEIRGDAAIFGGVAGVKGLRHRAEVAPYAAGL